MIKAENLRAMPAQHEFAAGEGIYPQLREDEIRWVAIWSGLDWCLYVSSPKYNKKQVRQFGKIVDAHMKKLINDILPADEEAMALYRK